MQRPHDAKIVLASVILLMAPGRALADLGPKPTQTFEFRFARGADGGQTPEDSALIQCEDAACTLGKPLQDYGPQHFSCDGGSCEAMAYAFTQYQRLSVRFPGQKTALSGVFRRSDALDARFIVSTDGAGLVIREQGTLAPKADIPPPVLLPHVVSKTKRFAKAASVTIIVELLIAAAFAMLSPPIPPKVKLRLLIGILAANAISIPAIWFLLPNVIPSIPAQEVLVWGFETVFIYALTRKSLSFRAVSFLTLAMNFASALADLLPALR